MVMTDENDSDKILTHGGLSTEVIKQGLPFALSACGFTQIGRHRLWGSEEVQILHPVRAEIQAASVLHPSTAHGISPIV
jgi:hypothetical protein